MKYKRWRKNMKFIEEKNVVIKNNAINKKFIEILKKICNDFKIDNYEVEIKNFLDDK